MRKFFLIMAIFLTLVSTISSQEKIDAVYLKNGDIIKGVIIENVPNDYVKIELQGGSIFTVKYSDILKMTKEKKIEEEKIQSEKEKLSSNTEGVSLNADINKMMLYQKESKSKATAILLSLLISSAGHAYAGDWGRGLLFLAGRLGSYAMIISGANSRGNEGVASAGLVLLLVLMIGEPIDAASAVDDYNDNLYERIYGRKPPLAINIVPQRKGLQLQFTYNF